MINAVGYAAYGLAHGVTFCSNANDKDSSDVKGNPAANKQSNIYNDINDNTNSTFANHNK